jgi:hypothetical protein
MSAGRYSFIIEQGATFNLEIQYKNSENTPIDLTGYGARMQIRPNVASSTIYLSLSSSLQADGTGLNMSGSSGTTSPTSGSIGIYISAATSSALNWDGDAYYDLEVFNPNNGTGGIESVNRILEGKVKLSKEVTR